ADRLEQERREKSLRLEHGALVEGEARELRNARTEHRLERARRRAGERHAGASRIVEAEKRPARGHEAIRRGARGAAIRARLEMWLPAREREHLHLRADEPRVPPRAIERAQLRSVEHRERGVEQVEELRVRLALARGL